MTHDDKTQLIELLSHTHAATQVLLAEIDLETQVYPDSDWKVRDILGHIATWDRQVAKSLQAYAAGSEYFIPNHDEDAFNRQDILRQQAYSSRQILSEWEEAREIFKEAVRGVPDEQFPGDLMYPWGDERGTIAALVKYMVEHDEEHHAEILKAVRSVH